MSQLASAWTKLASELKSKLRPSKKPTWTRAEHEATANHLIAYALSSPATWIVQGNADDGHAKLIFQKSEWSPGYTNEDWSAVIRIVREKMPTSTGFSAEDDDWGTVVVFSWEPPPST